MISKTSFTVTGSINKVLEKCSVRNDSGEAVWNAGMLFAKFSPLLEKYQHNIIY